MYKRRFAGSMGPAALGGRAGGKGKHGGGSNTHNHIATGEGGDSGGEPLAKRWRPLEVMAIAVYESDKAVETARGDGDCDMSTRIPL